MCLLDNMETPFVLQDPGKVFCGCDSTRLRCLSAPVSPGMGTVRFALLCLPASLRGRLSLHLLSRLPGDERDERSYGSWERRPMGNAHLACWPARTAFPKQWDPMDLQSIWKPSLNFLQTSEITYNVGMGHDVACELEAHLLFCSGVSSIFCWSCWVRSKSFCGAHRCALAVLWHYLR